MRRKLSKNTIVKVTYMDGSVYKEFRLDETPLKEDYILRISKEEYDNDEPCIIIRTCIRNQFTKELKKYLDKEIELLKKGIKLRNLPVEIYDAIDFDKVLELMIVCENVM